MNRSFWSLVVAQCQVFMNDNAAKLMLMVLATTVLPKEEAGVLKVVLAILIILPFVLLAPSVGWLSDRFSKRDILFYSQWMQVIIMGLLLLSACLQSIEVAVFSFFLLGLQCAIFTPAKQGIIKELVRDNKFNVAVSWIEATAIGSILLGSLAGGFAFDQAYSWMLGQEEKVILATPGAIDISTPFQSLRRAEPWMSPLTRQAAWQGAILVAAGLSLLATFGWWLCRRIEWTPPQSVQPFRTNLLWEHFVQLKEALETRPAMLCILGYSYFYALAAALYLTLIDVANDVGYTGGDTGTITGIFMALLGLGFISGSLLGNRLTFHHIELGLIPIGSAGLIAFTVALGFIPPTSDWFNVALFFLGLMGALFSVPLNVHLQDIVPSAKRGRILSANLLMTNLISIVAVMVYYFASVEFRLSSSQQFFVYAVPTAIVSFVVISLLPENLLRFTLGFFVRFVYRIQSQGIDHIPKYKGVLLVPNHMTYIDAIILQLACPRPIRYLVDESFYHKRIVGWGLKILRAIPISPKRAKTAIDQASEVLQKGEVVCVFPEGELMQMTTLGKLNRAYELIARKSGAPILPVWLENLWSSLFEKSRAKSFFRFPFIFPHHVDVSFGQLIPSEEAKPDRIQRDLYDLGQEAFSRRPELQSHLGCEAIKGLKSRFFQPVLIDAYNNGKIFRGGLLLAISIQLAHWIKEHIEEKRVGIVLPPGAGATIANLACLFADKIPVNLNFTAGPASNQAAIRRSKLQHIITASALENKIKNFPWTEKKVDLLQTLRSLRRISLFKWWLLGALLPTSFLRRLLHLPLYGDTQEAILLFTSGSSGEPKGVALSHRNIIANTAQCRAVFGEAELKTVLGCLPIFHSFGSTVTLWWPLLSGPCVVTYPNPLDTLKLIELIDKYRVELMVNTPTFLRSYLKRAQPGQMKSLKFVVVGAEKMPVDLLEAFESKFGVTVCEGYGMTEASPVVATNLLDQCPIRSHPFGLLGRRIGSVGRLVPGMSLRICHPESEEEQSLFKAGMVWLQGSNLFEGYLDDAKQTHAVLKKNWYRTGDIGRLDEDGFLHIEGRLSRFSKIAGEMAPHGTIEEKILIALEKLEKSHSVESHAASSEGESLQERSLVVMGIPDPTKGEAIVLLSTESIDLHLLRPQLLQLGLPNLWIPRFVKRVDHIPLLASGKLDIQGCQALIASLNLHPSTR